jgi:CarD family transcriptional regulator
MPDFSKGDHVAYPPHAAGTIVDVKSRDGAEYLSIAMLDSKMTLMVPSAIAQEKGVRPVISAKEADKLIKSLSQPGEPMLDNPQHRSRSTSDRTRTGSVEELAGVLRDLNSRAIGGAKRSPVEQKAFDTARQHLASEIALAKGVDETKAGDLIDASLAKADA